MYAHVVIDLETLGTTPGCEIIEIGACAFGGPSTVNKFSVLLSNRIPERRRVDASTEAWWRQQDFYLPDIALAEGIPVKHALLLFRGWMQAVADGDTQVWGNSPSFDCSILRDAYRYYDLGEAPWDFRMERDLRTLKSLMPIPREMWPADVLPKHRGLNDALYEAAFIARTLGIPFDASM